MITEYRCDWCGTSRDLGEKEARYIAPKQWARLPELERIGEPLTIPASEILCEECCDRYELAIARAKASSQAAQGRK